MSGDVNWPSDPKCPKAPAPERVTLPDIGRCGKCKTIDDKLDADGLCDMCAGRRSDLAVVVRRPDGTSRTVVEMDPEACSHPRERQYGYRSFTFCGICHAELTGKSETRIAPEGIRPK